MFNSRSLDIPITWSTFSTSISSNCFLFHTYCEFGCLSSHSCIRSLPSSLFPFLSGYSGSVWFRCMSSLRPPAKITSIPSPYEYSASCKAVDGQEISRQLLWVVHCVEHMFAACAQYYPYVRNTYLFYLTYSVALITYIKQESTNHQSLFI